MAEDLAKAQKSSLDEIEKRNTISGEWYRAFQTSLIPRCSRGSTTSYEIEGLFYQSDAKVNALRALVWRFGATGETKLIETIAHSKTQLASLLKETRDKTERRSCTNWSTISAPSSSGSSPSPTIPSLRNP